VLGLGLGPSIPLYTLAIQNAVEPRSLGVATAAATFFRQIGSTMGVTVLGLVFALMLGTGLQAVSIPPELPQLPTVSALETALNTAGEAEGSSPSATLPVDGPTFERAIDAAHAPGSEPNQQARAALSRYSAQTKAAVTSAIAW